MLTQIFRDDCVPVSLLMPNSPPSIIAKLAILWEQVLHSLNHVWASVCQRLALSFQSFPSHHKNVWTTCKYVFYSLLSSCTLALIFHVSLALFFPICNRTSCSHVAPLHCGSVSHIYYCRLPVSGLLGQPRVLRSI